MQPLAELKVQQVNPNSLSFDYRNPRIAEFNLASDAPEQDIIQILWDVMGVEEIVLSIRASGFFQHEPLIAVKENGRNVVIEGNRRLAAVKCILNPDLLPSGNKNPLQVSDEVKKGLQALPVIFVDKREDAWKFIGFKHINGPAKWGSYAKAQYISQIKNEYNIPLAEIATQIGDTHRTVQKLYQGLQVLNQAEKLKVFDRGDIKANRLYFSHLYTGLSYEGFKEYIGITDVKEEAEDPVPLAKKEQLGELLTWIYGSKKKDINPVIQSQNPDLRHLEAVLKSREATIALRDRKITLEQAYEISQPEEQTFEQSLLEAKRALQKAQSYQTVGFDGKNEQLLIHAASIAKIADELYESMEHKWRELNEPNDKKKRLFDKD